MFVKWTCVAVGSAYGMAAPTILVIRQDWVWFALFNLGAVTMFAIAARAKA